MHLKAKYKYCCCLIFYHIMFSGNAMTFCTLFEQEKTSNLKKNVQVIM